MGGQKMEPFTIQAFTDGKPPTVYMVELMTRRSAPVVVDLLASVKGRGDGATLEIFEMTLEAPVPAYRSRPRTLGILQSVATSRPGLVAIAATAIGGGLALNWSSLVALGAAPLIVGILPCAAMCALRLCLPMGSARKRASPIGGLEALTIEGTAGRSATSDESSSAVALSTQASIALGTTQGADAGCGPTSIQPTNTYTLVEGRLARRPRQHWRRQMSSNGERDIAHTDASGTVPKRAASSPRRLTRRGALGLFAARAALPLLAMGWSGPAFAATEDRFDYLSANGNSSCSRQFMKSIATMADDARLQGSCCSPMDRARYAAQIEGLKRYAAIAEIPADPYDIAAALAKHVMALYDDVLSGPEQAVYQYAMDHSAEQGPCCCQCWRWQVYGGLAKGLIKERGFTGEQIVDVWNLSDGCGGA